MTDKIPSKSTARDSFDETRGVLRGCQTTLPGGNQIVTPPRVGNAYMGILN